MNHKTENCYHASPAKSRRGDAGECGENENWRKALEAADQTRPNGQMRSTAQILAAMMRCGMLDALDESAEQLPRGEPSGGR